MNWGATLGGPMVRDKAFFFLSYDDLGVDIPTAVDFPTRPDLNESVTRTTDQTLLMGKIDFIGSASSRFALGYRYQELAETYLDVELGGGLHPSSTGNQDTNADAATLSHQWVPASGSVYNEARVYWYEWEQLTQPVSTVVGQQHPTYRLGQSWRMPQGGTEERLGIADTLSWFESDLLGIRGDHELKFGFEYSAWEMSAFFGLYSGGEYRYLSDAPDAPPYLYVKGVGDPSTSNDIDFWAFFAQDSWRASSRLTINLGVRWDLHDGAYNSDHVPNYEWMAEDRSEEGHWQPRIGFAYDLSGDGRAVIRGSAGSFYGQYYNVGPLEEDIFNGENFIISVFPCYMAPQLCTVENPPHPSMMVGLPPDVRSLVNPRSPHTEQFTLGSSVQMSASWVLEADLVYIDGFDEVIEIRENLRIDPTDPDSPRPHPEVGSRFSLHSSAQSEYRGLLAKLTKRFDDNWQMQLAYTLSETNNMAEFYALSAGDSRQPDPAAHDWGPGRQDQRHRVVANGLYQLPLGFSVSSILTWGSGWPWYTRLGFDANLDDSAELDRPADGTRNDQRSDDYFRWDFRFAKRFDWSAVGLELIAEVFNLTNNKHYDPQTYSNVVSSPDYGQPRPSAKSEFQPRQWQLAVRVTF
jgi:hypothetical protein